MQHSALHRARRLSASPGSTSSIIVLGAGSALLVPFLVLDLGIIVQLLASRAIPQELLFPSALANSWPFYGSKDVFLLVLVALAVVLAALEAAALILLQSVIQRTALQAASALRSAIHQQTFRLGPHELLDVTRSRPEELFSDKAELVRAGIACWWQAIPRSVVALFCLLALSTAVNFWLTLLAVLVAIYSVRTYAGMNSKLQDRARQWREAAASSRQRLLERLSLAPLRVGYELEEPSQESFQRQLRPFETAELKANTSEALLGPLVLLIGLIAAAFLLLIIGLARDFSVAEVVLLLSAMLCAIIPARRLYRLPTALAPAEAAASEIFAFLDREPEGHDMAEAVELQRLQSEVRLDQVTLTRRDGRQLLEDISFRFPAGRRVALLASDRQTPLALAGLFVRFYDPAAGAVLFDGQNIQQAKLATLRGQALLVPGEGLVFSGSVTENVMCGNNGFTTLEVTDALKMVRAYEFVQNLPDSLATQLDAFDRRLSPDEGFRLGLARALVRDPALLVIQEPHADWDPEDERLHAEALRDISTGRTVVIIPSRLDTLREVDTIFLFHQGKLHDQGTHAELLRRSELYRHLIYVRFNAFRDEVEW